MATWPAYAGIREDGFGEQRESALERSEMESGPAKQARVLSRVMVRRSITVDIEALADYRAFIAWFKNDISEGALWFDWSDPVDGATKPARVVAAEWMDAKPRAGLRNWEIPMTIETWG